MKKLFNKYEKGEKLLAKTLTSVQNGAYPYKIIKGRERLGESTIKGDVNIM